MFRSLLVPVDLVAQSGKRRALAVAADMAERYDADLTVMTVIPDFGMSIVGAFFDEGFAERAMAEARARLHAFCTEQLPGARRLHQHVCQGPIYDQILRCAHTFAADCIVIGSHRPELKDYLLGPNAARVVRHAPCSVMVVRADLSDART